MDPQSSNDAIFVARSRYYKLEKSNDAIFVVMSKGHVGGQPLIKKVENIVEGHD